MCRCVGTAPGILGLVWRVFCPNPVSKLKISGRIFKSFPGHLGSAEHPLGKFVEQCKPFRVVAETLKHQPRIVQDRVVLPASWRRPFFSSMQPFVDVRFWGVACPASSMLGRFVAQPGPRGAGKGLDRVPARFSLIFSPVDKF